MIQSLVTKLVEKRLFGILQNIRHDLLKQILEK